MFNSKFNFNNPSNNNIVLYSDAKLALTCSFSTKSELLINSLSQDSDLDVDEKDSSLLDISDDKSLDKNKLAKKAKNYLTKVYDVTYKPLNTLNRKSIYIKYMEFAIGNNITKLNKKTILQRIIELNLKPEVDYRILVKINYGEYGHLTAGPQFLFTFNSDISLEIAVENLVSSTNLRLNALFDRYLFEINSNTELEFSFYAIDRTELLPKLNDKYNNELLNLYSDNTIRSVRSLSKILPNKMDLNLYGILIKDNEVIEQIINNNPKYKVVVGYSLFKKSYNNKIIYIIINTTLNPLTFKGDIFDENFIFLDEFIDLFIHENSFKRTNKLVTTTYEFGEVIDYIQNIALPPIINDYKENKVLDTVDTHFGSFDIETYLDNNGLAKPYAIGFNSYAHKITKTYYINQDLDSNRMFDECFKLMLTEKYRGHVFYVHNLSGFDIVFILNFIAKHINDKNSIYRFEIIPRDSDIISITIRSGKNYFKLVDSYLITTLTYFYRNNRIFSCDQIYFIFCFI